MLVSPADTTPLTEVTDVELVWNPVLGAESYQLDVNLSEDFTGQAIENGRTVYGTRYSPETTYDNGAYHWRVRPRDEGGHFGEWSETFSFTRNWTSTPVLAAPTNGEIMLDPFEFSWNPVDHASEYEVQVGDDPNFSAGTFDECSTLQTKVTPYDMDQGSTFGGCGIFDGVGHGTTYHWRVRGIDEPKGVLGHLSGQRGAPAVGAPAGLRTQPGRAARLGGRRRVPVVQRARAASTSAPLTSAGVAPPTGGHSPSGSRAPAPRVRRALLPPARAGQGAASGDGARARHRARALERARPAPP
jgi:hypothetical protein